MSIERSLRDTLATESARTDSFQRQLEAFREFERRLNQGGLAIVREEFSIPLMERVAPVSMYQPS